MLVLKICSFRMVVTGCILCNHMVYPIWISEIPAGRIPPPWSIGIQGSPSPTFPAKQVSPLKRQSHDGYGSVLIRVEQVVFELCTCRYSELKHIKLKMWCWNMFSYSFHESFCLFRLSLSESNGFWKKKISETQAETLALIKLGLENTVGQFRYKKIANCTLTTKTSNLTVF
jgi:hypothetical protein